MTTVRIPLAPETPTHRSSPSVEPVRRDVQVLDALASRPRARILELLGVRPMSVAELERELHHPRVTLRYHLSVLLGQGLVEEVETPGTRRVGRPPKRFRAARKQAIPGYPLRRYDLLGEIALEVFVKEVGEARALKLLRRKGQEIGELMVQGVAAERGVTRWTPEAFERHVLEGLYRSQGSAVDVTSRTGKEITYRSSHCPFLELAEKHPHIVCDALDAGYHEGVDRGLGGVRTERIACMVHDSPYCEYRMSWRRGAKRGR